jgi:hypothetical protein
MSDALVPPPRPDIATLVVRTQQSAAIHNPLSVLLGIFPNNLASLEDEMVEIVHKPPNKQHLANNDAKISFYCLLAALLTTKQQLNARQQRTANEMCSLSFWTSWIGASFLGKSNQMKNMYLYVDCGVSFFVHNLHYFISF